MNKNQVSIVNSAYEEAELAVGQGAERAVVKDAKTGPEALRVAARKSRVVIGVAQGPEIQIA
jgi:hypothetical protein